MRKTLLFFFMVLPLVNAIPDLRDNTIILYNTNTPDAIDIAQYYAIARGISFDRLCPVQFPPGQFATADQMMGARRNIIENCICDAIQDTHGYVLTPCNTSNLDEIANLTPITHMVIIRGIPPRLTGTGWPTDSSEPSLDYYLSISLYGYNHLFDEGEVGRPYGYGDSNYYGAAVDSVDFQANGVYVAYTRPIIPSIDKLVAYGRVEAMTKERTYNLIDRTIEAENNGLTGNYLTGLFPQSNKNLTYDYFRELTSSLDPICKDYLSGPGNWPHESCRTGASANGQLPGETHDTLPRGINTGVFLNENYNGNGQSGFDNFNVMTRWHKTEYDCTELCRDFADPTDEANCRATSTDYFKEINTDCVGGAPGMIGYQKRSFPVQYYGFWPSGWTQISAGPSDKTPPYIINSGGFMNTRFNDEKFLRFGSNESVPAPECTLEDGTIEICDEIVGVDLTKIIYFSGAAKKTNLTNYTLRFRMKNRPSPGSRVYVRPRVRFDGNTSDTYFPSKWIDMAIERTAWTEFEYNFTLGHINATINRMTMDIYTTIAWAPHDLVDFDAFELIDLSTGEQLWDVDESSFNAPYIGYTTYGDYAANSIDRLGGIAWWGSSSHHLTYGHAFNQPEYFQQAFYLGRTLGEGIARTGDSAMSGIFYGDPLYNPSGVKIFINDGLQSLRRLPVRDRLTIDHSSSDRIYINAFHGKAKQATTSWELGICPDKYPEECTVWSTVASGTGAVYEHLITDNFTSILPDTENRHTIVLRLRVWNPGEEYDDIYNYAYLNYDSFPAHCVDDDGDSVYVDCGLPDCDDNNPDVHPMKLEECNGIDDDCDGVIDEHCECKSDLNGDGRMNQTDWDIFDADYGRTDCFDPDEFCCVPNQDPCEGDLDFNGVVSYQDRSMMTNFETLCGSVPCQADLDDDGDVDTDDMNIFDSEFGADCAANPCQADFDNDGDVDMDDLDVLMSELGRTNCPTCNSDTVCDATESALSCPQDCYCVSDLNHDGSVNMGDYTIFSQYLGWTNCSITYCIGDFDSDGDVDNDDQTIFLNDWSRTDCPTCNDDGSCDLWEDSATCPNDCVSEPLCIEAIPGFNGDTENRVNIVFIGINYNDTSVLQDAIDTYYINTDTNLRGQLFYFEPFKSNMNKFNVWYVDEIGNVSEYNEDPYNPNNYGQEAVPEIERLTQYCDLPNKQEVALINWYFRANGAPGKIRLDHRTDNPPHSGQTFVHEFAHAFGNLKDEYSHGVIFGVSTDYRNCDIATETEACSKWCSGPPMSIEDLRDITCPGSNRSSCMVSGRPCIWLDPDDGPINGQSGCVNRVELCNSIVDRTDCNNAVNNYWRGSLCIWMDQPTLPSFSYHKTNCIATYSHDVDIGTDCLPGLGCFQTCGASNYFKPYPNTMMRSTGLPFYYINEKLICEEIEEIAGSVGGRCTEIRNNPGQCVDKDNDGYGDLASSLCTNPEKDCNDYFPTANPGASEICENGLDDDCDGSIDEECECTSGIPRDCGNDTGECQTGTEQCVDGDWTGVCVGEIRPSAEVCDGLDNDCNGVADDADFGTTTCGQGECLHTIDNCQAGEEQTCDEYEGAQPEVCEGVLDEDCDGVVDNGCDCATDLDTDCDGFISDMELLSAASKWLQAQISDMELLQAASIWLSSSS